MPYTIPAGNPFIGQVGKRAEIWAYGLRNPWRFDFDAPAGLAPLLYIADVGQDVYEEIDVVHTSEAGVNFGWRVAEGMHCYPASASCNTAGLRAPVVEYSHTEGCSITGGFVYRGTAIPELRGRYFYADYCQGWLASIYDAGTAGFVTRRWTVPNVGNVLSFGQDAAGELYILSASGTVHRIVRRATPA